MSLSLPISLIVGGTDAAGRQRLEAEKRERRGKGLSGAWIGVAADEQHRSWTPCP